MATQQTPKRSASGNGQDELEKLKEDELVSSLKSDRNPRTIYRQKQILEGNPLFVHFDERVIVHSIPDTDPSRYSAAEWMTENDKIDGGKCCTIL